MNLLTRISATLNGKLEDMVSHVENHDAVVAVALKDTRAAVAKARIRLDRVRKDGEKMRKRLAEAHRMETLWTDRARQVAQEDEAKALECVARRNQCREQILQTEEALSRHEELEKQVGESVRKMEKRLSEIAQQQNLMRSRQSTADALRVINKIEGNADNGIEDTFDRWEMLITETEYSNGNLTEIDSLDTAFLKQENATELKAELDELLNEPKGKKE
jgi:phage shock protein A